jgi:hypothetical protein
MATGGATTGTGDPSMFREKPTLYPDVMDETEPVDYQLASNKDSRASADTRLLMEVSTDGNRTGTSDLLANSMRLVDKEGEEMVTVASVGRILWSYFVGANDS